MGQPTICINPYDEVYFPIYADTYTNERIGTLYPGEMFVDMDEAGSSRPHYAYTSKKGWTRCYIPTGNWTVDLPFDSFHSFGWSACRETVQGYMFKVRSACRVFEGTTFVTRLYEGDVIYTDGSSDAGATYPHRLSIRGYKKSNGECKWLKNGWCDTDMELGRTMYYESCVYGKFWFY